MAELEDPNVEPIPISSLDNLAYAPLQLVGEVDIAHSFREGDKSDMSSGEAYMALRLRTLS